MNAHDVTTINRTYRRLEEMVPDHWQSGTVLANGLHQHYTRTGDEKPVLLLLHGFMMNGLTWLRVAMTLQDEYDIIMPDARGHGHTQGEAVGKATETLVEDVAAFMRALNLEAPFVLGHSMGAGTAVGLAVKYPELMRAILLEDPPLRPIPTVVWESDGYKAWQAQWLEYLRALRTQTHEERIAATLVQNPFVASSSEEDFVTMLEAQAQFNLEMMAYFTETDETTPPLVEVIPQVTRPQLLMLARPADSPYLNSERIEQGKRDVEAVTSRWRDGELVVFEETGHFIHGERPERFIKAVRAFLSQH